MVSLSVVEGLVPFFVESAVTLSQKQKAEDSYGLISRYPLEYRIRTTREEDIDDIAAILSATADEEPGGGNSHKWKANMENVRRLQSFKDSLKTRYKSLVEGKKAFSRVEDKIRDYDGTCGGISETDRLRLLWGDNESLRDNIRRAAQQSKEPHPWKKHKFDLCPPDATHLQHMMITAEHVRSGHIVGFCEVAMMYTPDSGEDVSPTIANLVTARSYRRRGIGRTLLESAKKYVRLHWDADRVALYVKKSNPDAISLYSKQGFEELCSVDDTDDCSYMIIETASSDVTALQAA